MTLDEAYRAAVQHHLAGRLQQANALRGLSMAAAPQVEPAVKASEVAFLDSVRNRKTRSLSLGEREQIAEIASTKPKVDLEIHSCLSCAARLTCRGPRQ